MTLEETFKNKCVECGKPARAIWCSIECWKKCPDTNQFLLQWHTERNHPTCMLSVAQKIEVARIEAAEAEELSDGNS